MQPVPVTYSYIHIQLHTFSYKLEFVLLKLHVHVPFYGLFQPTLAHFMWSTTVGKFTPQDFFTNNHGSMLHVRKRPNTHKYAIVRGCLNNSLLYMQCLGMRILHSSTITLTITENFRVVKFSCDNISCCKILVVRGYPRKYLNGDVEKHGASTRALVRFRRGYERGKVK